MTLWTMKADSADFLNFLRSKTLFAAFCATFLPSFTAANDFDVTARQTLGIERSAEMYEDGEDLRYDFQTGPISETYIALSRQLESGAKLKFSTQIDISGTKSDRHGRTNGGAFTTQYQKNFGDSNAWQLRVTGTADWSSEESRLTFQRERLGVRLRLRHNPKHETAGMFRIGYRDQNDNTFYGYDQLEYLALVQHNWRPTRDRLSFTGTAYVEHRDADLDRYSYQELGMRLSARMPVFERTELKVQGTLFERQYEDPFSATDPTIRDDVRFKSIINVKHSFNDRVDGELFVGWDHNESNVADREYEGSVFGLKVSYNFE